MIHAPDLAARLDLHRIRGRNEWRGRCPSCGYATTFIVRQKDGRALWGCVSCQDREAVTAAVLLAAGGAYVPPLPSLPAPPDKAAEGRRIARALALWHRAQDATGSPADTYLAARGVLGGWHIAPAADRTALRYLSRCPHPGGGELPAMLALIRNVQTGEPQAIHRTYLRADGSGKAEVEPAKATLGPVAGGAIMLHPPCGDESLIVAEGIETALAAALLMRAPAWAAVSAGNLERLALPTLPALPDLIVAADHDQPGQRSAQAAATRWREEGRRVRVAMPKAPGADFADLMEAHHG